MGKVNINIIHGKEQVCNKYGMKVITLFFTIRRESFTRYSYTTYYMIKKI